MNFFRLLAFLVFPLTAFAAELPPLDLGGVREEHMMIPMRDGTRLSAYVYRPQGAGPWPVVFEQRYAVITGTASRKELAALAAHGYVAARVSFRGSQLSEGVWRGYRALAWGEQQDGGPIPIDFPANPVTATNTLHHEKARASHLIAPVVR
jgi:predicted acyl esterase